MKSSSPCMPPVAWPQQNPPAGKNFGTNSADGALGSVWSSDQSKILLSEWCTRNPTTLRKSREVIRRWVGPVRRYSTGSVQPYGSLSARAGQNRVSCQLHHPHLATVKPFLLSCSEITTQVLFLLVENFLCWSEVLLPFILLSPDHASTPSASICTRGGSESSSR